MGNDEDDDDGDTNLISTQWILEFLKGCNS